MVALDLQLIAQCSTLYMPGRMDIRRTQDRKWVLDVCHNPDGVRFFLRELALESSALPILFARCWLAKITKVSTSALLMPQARISLGYLSIATAIVR